MAVAAIGVQLTVQLASFYRAVSGMQLHIALQRIDVDASVVRVQINRARQSIRSNRSIACFHRDISIDGAGLDRAVSRMCIQISILRHAYFDMKSPPTAAPGKSPMSGSPRD